MGSFRPMSHYISKTVQDRDTVDGYEESYVIYFSAGWTTAMKYCTVNSRPI